MYLSKVVNCFPNAILVYRTMTHNVMRTSRVLSSTWNSVIPSNMDSRKPRKHGSDRTLPQCFLHHTRNFKMGTSVSDNGLPKEDSNLKFETIYKHNYITAIAVISKCKSVVYLAALFDLGLCLYSSHMGLGNVLFYASAIAVTTFSVYATKLVGTIAIDADGQKIRVSHLNFRGSRKELYLNFRDVVPLSQYTGYTEKKVPFCTKDGEVQLYISFAKNNIRDYDKLSEVLNYQK